MERQKRTEPQKQHLYMNQNSTATGVKFSQPWKNPGNAKLEKSESATELHQFERLNKN